MMTTDERLAYMADQIARNFVALGHETAVAATADHIATFWEPRMRARAFELLRDQAAAFTPLAAAALHLLETRGAPAPQSRASTFSTAGDATDRSDAG
jgi:formate dehydrogenase subunit delta